MRNLKTFISVVALSALLMGCSATANGGNKSLLGGLGGAALGGWLGSKVGGGNGKLAATAGGALLGLFVGSNIGQSLDRADTAYARPQVAPAPVTYSAPMPQYRPAPRYNYYSVRPRHNRRQHTYRQPRRDCRQYTDEVLIHGRWERVTGMACRQHDGTWRRVRN